MTDASPEGPVKRGPYHKPVLTAFEKKLWEDMLDNAAEQVMFAQASNGGRLPYRMMETLLAELKKHQMFANADRYTVRNHLEKYKAKIPVVNDDDEAPPTVTPSPPTRNKGGQKEGNTKAA
jgi:hypothetical protein